MKIEATGKIEATSSIEAIADTRYSFGPQYLLAAKMFAERTADIEQKAGNSIEEDMRVEHQGYVVSAIMQCAAALETEIDEVIFQGPGAHLGSGKTDTVARDFLRPLVYLIDRAPGVLSRYETVLHLLNRPGLSKDRQPFQDTDLLIKLRNELVHYKSRWGREMENKKLFTSLLNLRHPKPPFVHDSQNFFPHHCLSAACAMWAFETSVNFVDDFYSLLGVPSRLDGYRARL